MPKSWGGPMMPPSSGRPRLLAGTGHRPDKLGGFDPNNRLRQGLRAEARRRVERWAPSGVISGMALGFDQDLAQIAIDLGIRWTAAVPFKGQEARWPLTSQREYQRLLELAAGIIYVSAPALSNRDAARKLHLRNEWMLAQLGRSGVLLAAWDGTPGGTASCYAIAEARGLLIDRIDPRAFG